MWQMQELPQPEVHKRRCVKPTTNGDSAPLVTVTKVAREDICHAGDGSGASLLQARIARTPHPTDVYIPLPLRDYRRSRQQDQDRREAKKQKHQEGASKAMAEGIARAAAAVKKQPSLAASDDPAECMVGGCRDYP